MQTALTPLKLVTELWFLHSELSLLALYQYIKFYFYSLLYFQSCAPDKLFIAKIEKGK